MSRSTVQDRRARAPDLPYHRLKPGPGRDRRIVEADQRRRIERAVIELVAAGGYGSVTMRKLAALAGVSTATVYAQFTGKDDCILSTHASVTERVIDRISSLRPDDRGSHRPPIPVMQRVLDVFADDPGAARLALIDVFDAGAIAPTRVRTFEQGLARALCVAIERTGQRPISEFMGRWLAAGGLRVVRTALIGGRSAPLEKTVRELCRWSDTALAMGLPELPPIAAGRGRPLMPEVAPAVPEVAGRRPDRDLLLAAAADIGADLGYWRLSPRAIRRAAGVTRASFDRHFHGLDDCYLAAVERLSERYLDRTLLGSPGSDRGETMRRWAARLHAAAVSDPPTARLVFVGILAPGTAGLLRRERVVTEFAVRLRRTLRGGLGVRWDSAELDVAALWAALADQLAQRDAY